MKKLAKCASAGSSANCARTRVPVRTGRAWARFRRPAPPSRSPRRDGPPRATGAARNRRRVRSMKALRRARRPQRQRAHAPTDSRAFAPDRLPRGAGFTREFGPRAAASAYTGRTFPPQDIRDMRHVPAARDFRGPRRQLAGGVHRRRARAAQARPRHADQRRQQRRLRRGVGRCPAAAAGAAWTSPTRPNGRRSTLDSGTASISCSTDYATDGDGETVQRPEFFTVLDAMLPCKDAGVRAAALSRPRRRRLHRAGRARRRHGRRAWASAQRILDIDSSGGQVEDAIRAGDVDRRRRLDDLGARGRGLPQRVRADARRRRRSRDLRHGRHPSHHPHPVRRDLARGAERASCAKCTTR